MKKSNMMRPLKSTLILCSFIFVCSLCLLLGSCLVKDTTLTASMLSVGCSLLASSFLIILTYFIYHETSDEEKIINEWGMNGIYYRRDKSSRSNPKLSKMKYKWDVIAFGMRGLRDAMATQIEQQIEKGVQVRILTISPESKYLVQQEIDEGEIQGQIKKTIIDLESWIKRIQKKHSNVHIKFYDALPLDLYFRIDDVLFVGPYLNGITSQQTITYEYNEKGEAFKAYSQYFEKLWGNDEFAKSEY